VQTSLYGASKAAAEGYLGAYAEAGHLSVTAFRFVSILGPRYTHGHVIDFVAQLRRDPSVLRVLGDGTQRKSYLEVGDCVRAVMSRIEHRPSFEVFNLGVDSFCTVRDSIGWITQRLGLEPVLQFSGGNRGWVGDNPFIFLDTARIRATGWEPKFTIREAVERTVDFLLENEWLLAGHDPAR
jgi:UDP-glucose 4-epimerase